MNDLNAVEAVLQNKDISSVIIEGIQGIGGVYCPEDEFIRSLSTLCEKYGAVLILDEIQSGYGRTGKFFAHQYQNIQPDIITVSKGMGNGFPLAGVLINPKFKAKYGMLGTTFGGNHLACSAGIAVLEVIEKDQLIENAYKVGNYLIKKLSEIHTIKEVRGKGLLIGIEFPFATDELRNLLIAEENVFTGSSKDKNVIRLLPPLCISIPDADLFIDKLKKCLNK